MREKKNQNESFLWLDLLRGASALVVVICHLRALTFVVYKEAATTNLAAKAFYFFTSQFGSMAVIVFFALSGFFISRSIDNSIANQTWSFKSYFIARLTRLYVVLVPALILTLGLDICGYYFLKDAPFYSDALTHLDDVGAIERLDAKHFFASLFYLQAIVVKPFGSNGPLWSLSYEFWFYVLFPLLLFAAIPFYSLKRRLFLALCAFALIFALTIFTYKVHVGFVLWLAGVAVFYLSKKYTDVRYDGRKTFFACLLLLAVMLLGRLEFLSFEVRNFLIAISAGHVVFMLIRTPFPAFLKGIAKFLSNISYTLYLIHFPLLAFITSLSGLYRLTFSYSALAKYALLLGFTILFAYGLYWLFERNTKYIASLVSNALTKKRKSVEQPLSA